MAKQYVVLAVALIALALLSGFKLPSQIYTADYGTPLSDWIGGGYGTIEYIGGRDLSVIRFACTKDSYPATNFCFVGIVAGSRNTYVPTTEYSPSMSMIRVGDTYRVQIAPNQGAYLWYRYYTTCGNNVCDASFDETATSCPSDCGSSVASTTTTIYQPPWATTTTVPGAATTTTLPSTPGGTGTLFDVISNAITRFFSPLLRWLGWMR